MEKHWIHYLTRPFSLLGTSLWYIWYADYAQRFAETDISDMLCVEESAGVVRHYRVKEELQHCRESIGSLAITDRKEYLKLLSKAGEYNLLAQKYIDKEKEFTFLQDAVNFFCELALHGTIIPYFGLEMLTARQKSDPEVIKICEDLRAQSLYPKTLTDVVRPMIIGQMKRNGFTDAEGAADHILIEEALRGDYVPVADRLEQRKNGKIFVYEAKDRNISVTWHDDNTEAIKEIEGSYEDVKEFEGKVAYPGVVQGIARIVKTIDGKGVTFEKGDILVSINSNPNLMSLIQKAGAIVTDEGGITCHAAIISRELKIPCIIGTKAATRILKDGDMVEVDANSGVVRIL